LHPRYRPLAEFYRRCGTRSEAAERVGWCGRWDQELRFEALLGVFASRTRPCSVLDVGCGHGGLYAYLQRRGYDAVDYTGIDVLPDMVAAARARHPDGTFLNADLLSPETPAGPFDYVLCSGALNVGVAGDHDHWAEQMLGAMWRRTERALAVNVLDVASPTQAIGAAGESFIRRFERDRVANLCRALTPRVVVREDVLPGDLVVWCHRGPSVVVERWREWGGASPVNLALAHLEHRLPEAALEVLDDVEDDTPEVVNLRAVALLQLGEHEMAGHLLRGVLDGAPNYGPSLRNLASALAMGGDEAGAITQWRRVLARDPHDDHARVSLCKAHLRLGDVEAAMREADRIEEEVVRDRFLEAVGEG